MTGVIRRHRNPLTPSLASRRSQKFQTNLAKMHIAAQRRPKAEAVERLRDIGRDGVGQVPLRPGPEQPLDILLPLGAGSRRDNFELRIALRSIERFATGWRKIWIVGVDPGFLAPSPKLELRTCEERGSNHESRIAGKLDWAFASLPIASHAIMWNDDYVLRAPVDLRTVDFYQRGGLIESAEQRRVDRYARALFLTGRYLKACGFPAHHFATQEDQRRLPGKAPDLETHRVDRQKSGQPDKPVDTPFIGLEPHSFGQVPERSLPFPIQLKREVVRIHCPVMTDGMCARHLKSLLLPNQPSQFRIRTGIRHRT